MRAYLEVARENRKLRKIALIVAVFAAVLVIFGVFWGLKNTGIAMTGDPTCGYVEHTHTDACYEKKLTCGKEETKGHKHSAENGCYAAAESEAAESTDGTDAKANTKADTTTEGAQQTLICEKAETPAHAHSDACYEQTLTCTTPEHTHTQSCYGDADEETAKDWEATLPKNLTGTWTKDVVAVAQSQLDYTESQNNLTTNKKGEQKGYTRYGAWSGNPYADWSVPFAAFCLHYVGADAYPVELTAPTWVKALQNEKYGLYHSVESGYEPKVGDMVFFAAEDDANKVKAARTKAAEALEKDKDAAKDQAKIEAAYADVAALADHAGVIEKVLPADKNNPARISVIEGDYKDKVQRVEYECNSKSTDKRIIGYAELPKNAQALQDIVKANGANAEEDEGADAKTESKNQTTQTFEGEGYSVKAAYGPGAQLPEGAQLRATEFAKDSEHYKQRYAEAAAQYGWDAEPADGLRLFDVGFYVGEEEVEPAAPVQVTISCVGQQETTYDIVHFGDELETVEAETSNNNNGQDISFTLNSFSELFAVPQTLSETYATTTTNEVASTNKNAAKLTSHKKTIDALRAHTGAENPDTTLDGSTDAGGNYTPGTVDTTDLYRLYLDATLETETQGIDLVIVVDESSSMDKQIGNKRRDKVVQEILNDSGSEPGLINSFLAPNPKNRVAVVGFMGDARNTGYSTDVEMLSTSGQHKEGDWISGKCDPVKVEAKGIEWAGIPLLSSPTGNHYTNYIAGLQKAEDLFKQSGTNRKVLIFLSDGVPTIYYPNYSPGNSLQNESKGGGGYGYEDPEIIRKSTSNTISYFSNFVTTNGDIEVFTVGIGAKPSNVQKDASEEQIPGILAERHGNDSVGPELLSWMAKTGGGAYSQAESVKSLENALREFATGSYATNLKIEDTLSEYVDLYGDVSQADFKVTMCKKDEAGNVVGEPVVLYENGAKTSEGETCLESVTYDSSSKKVTAQFKEDYQVESGWTYTLSFNVKASNQAYTERDANIKVDSTDPYNGVKGDKDTDYPGNDTSSLKPGFHSNADNGAKVSFDSGGSTHSVGYPHPVIQVTGEKPSTGTGSGGGTVPDATLAAHKTIDAFRDGDDNLDTTLDNNAKDKTDLYRLYLDAELSKINNPIDLLIIVDQSGSMHPTYKGASDIKDMKKENNQDAYRDEALRFVLNGTSNKANYEASKNNGLITEFLAANDENQVAVVGFQGAGYVNKGRKRLCGYGTTYTFKTDANGELANIANGNIQTDDNDRNSKKNQHYAGGIVDANEYFEAMTLLDWTSDAQFVDVQGIPYNATNYTAGLLQAKRVISEPQVDNNHQKVILFLSDGEPTAHIEKGNGYYYRDGTGNSKDDARITDYLTDLMKVYPDAILHTVSINGGNAEDVLKTMTRNDGSCFSVTQTDDLKGKLQQLMKGVCYSNLVIQDKLSEYVEYYEDQPDVKVVLKDAAGNEKTLAEGGDILKSVDYDSASKTVKATLEPSYIPEPGTTITLSFNVKVNDHAYQKYAKSGYDKDESGQAVIAGDDGTDYSENLTSSGQNGFRSNKEANLFFKKGNDKDTSKVDYPHPVVQVASCDFVLMKTNDTYQTPLAGAKFDLYREAKNGESNTVPGSSIGLSGDNGRKNYVKVKEGLTTSATTDSGEGGQVKVERLQPGQYWLVETDAPLGYSMLTKPIPIELTRRAGNIHGEIVGDSKSITIDNEEVAQKESESGDENWPILKVKNKAGAQLPMTGGPGVESFLALGALLMVAAGTGIALKRRRTKRI